MKKVLIDNWSMHNIAQGMNGQIAEEYSDLLSTLVLWDEIYYPNNDRSSYWDNTPQNMSCIEFALLLRKEKPVIDYRKFLVEMEDELNQAHWQRIFEFQQAWQLHYF